MKTKTIKLDICQAIIADADTLAERHATYVSDFVTRANTELYAILAEILKLHEQMEGSKQRDKLIKRMRQYLKSTHNIKTQANTKTTALVTKYVTRASRKTAHVYSRVLEVAIANGIGSADLVAFIQTKGGIDKVRMAVASAEAVTQHNALIKHYQIQLRDQLAHKQAIGVVDLSAVERTLPHATDVDFQHLLCRFNHETQANEIVCVMYPSSALETQAMNEYLTMLDVACNSDKNTFYERCKQHGLNMDILLRWMGANGIKDAAAARAIGAKLKSAAEASANPPPASMLKAA
uniref:hypothetical protein n=1 Tax=Shewanella sp. TaxID=50422 RepID=UPI0040484BE9